MDGTQLEALNGMEKQRLYQAAEMLLEARRTLQPMDELPPGLRPKTLEEAYFIQDVILQALGKAGGWKVGAPAPDATPVYAPMPSIGIATSGDRIARQYRRMRGVEAEIAFLLGKDLPPRAAPYSREELVNAIASCHPAIELLESGLLDPETADRLTAIADLQSNGGFVAGLPISGWEEFNFENESADAFGWLCARRKREKRRRSGPPATGFVVGQRSAKPYRRFVSRAMDHNRKLDGQDPG